MELSQETKHSIQLPTESEPCVIIQNDALAVLKKFPDNSFQCCVTSPPYWGLRDYGIKHQIGAEMVLRDYITKLVNVFTEVYRVLNSDGTLWLNIGYSNTSGGRTWRDSDKKNRGRGMDYRAPTPEGIKAQGPYWSSLACSIRIASSRLASTVRYHLAQT